MCKVYVSGALTDAASLDEIKTFYEDIGSLCEEMSLEPYVPHLHSDPEKNPDLTPHKVYELDRSQVEASELIIAYVGRPSLGVGMELGWADAWNIPVMLLREEGRRVSRLPRGIPSVIAEIRFKDYEDALEQLRTSIERSGFPG